MLRTVATYFSKPISRWLMRTLPLTEPWERFPAAVPLGVFGLGARRAFRWYFEGESAVSVRSVEEVRDWLLGCTYMRDPELFQEADFWQHPCTFEALRRGDCEDFSLWAWRKLVRLGHDAEFVVGICRSPGCTAAHTWVVFEDQGVPYVLDPVVNDPEEMIRPLDEVRHAYVPEASVDRHFNRYVFAGYFYRRRGGDAVPEGRTMAAVAGG